jgi:signal transduction histidine kinase
MRGLFLSIVLFVFFSDPAHAQGSQTDSLNSIVSNHSNDTTRLIALKKISKLYFKSQPDSAFYYANKMLTLAKEKKIYYYASDAFDLISNLYERSGKLEQSITATDSASYYAQLIDDMVGVIFFINNKATIYMKMGQYFDALQLLEQVKKIAERIGEPAGMAAALNNMGAVYHYLGDDEASLNYFIKAYKLRLKNNITKNLAYSLNNIGALYANYGNYSDALEYHNKAMQAAIERNDGYNYLVALSNLGMDYRFQKKFNQSLKYYNLALREAKKQDDKTMMAHAMERMSAVYIDTDSLHKAKPLLIKALDLARETGNKYDITSFCNSLGNIYLNEQNFAKALPLFTEALHLSKEISATPIEVDVYKSLTAYYYAANNSTKAFAFQKLYDAKRDSLYEAETDLKIANLKNRFELENKLSELKQKELELSISKTESNERLKIIYIISISGLALLLLVVYILMLYRKIKRKNRIIRQNEEKVTLLLNKEQDHVKLKTRLISTVSHEFRTPLAIISSNAQLLRDYYDNMDESMRKETLGFIQGGINNITAMMQRFELLDQKTLLEFKPEKTNLRQLLNSISSELQSLPKFEGRIILSDKLSTPDFFADKNLITHIVRNLLSNALKYSGKKPVYFKFHNTTGFVVLIIEDAGSGMSEQDVQKIFDDFHRGENAANIKGTGIGMSVVKRCVDLHNGKIDIKSKFGKGTTIEVILPAKTDEN